MFYAWSNVKRVLITANLYAFVMQDTMSLFFNKKDVEGQQHVVQQYWQTYAPKAQVTTIEGPAR